MARIRHGVAGKPVAHSLSPVLTALVHAHLSRKNQIDLPGLKGVAIIPTEGVENALAWGYAGSLPSPPDWDYVNSPLGKFRANALLDRAVNASMEYVDPDIRLPNTELPKQNFKKHPYHEDEVWISLTSPLKHQLSAAAVKCVDNAMEIRSVNTLRWDGQSWWAASTDGMGMRIVAEAFGYPTSGVIGITGGGGAARSVASAWTQGGGQVRQLGGRRTLDENGPWSLCDSSSDFEVDFDTDNGDISVGYKKMEGDFDSRVNYLSKNADGRWFLCAQHLMSWAKLWAPEYSSDLPSLSLLMTRLIAVEVHLS